MAPGRSFGQMAGDIGKPIAERLPFAALILASPSRQAHPQRDRRPLGRQILQPANLPAVTTGASSAPLAEGQNRPATVEALRPKKLEAGSQSPFGIFDHATIDPVCSPAVKPDPRSHEVRKTRLSAARHRLAPVADPSPRTHAYLSSRSVTPSAVNAGTSAGSRNISTALPASSFATTARSKTATHSAPVRRERYKTPSTAKR
jgi:hypothetical protein